eukprot:scaffold406313_cov47-Attheya_sp.AAC.1
MFNDEVGDHEAVERRATISCAACGEWSVDQGYENYVNPDILREVHGYATAMNKLVVQEKMRMKEFDVALDQAISLYREKKDNAAMLLSVCIGDVNEKHTTGRRKLGRQGLPLETVSSNEVFSGKCLTRYRCYRSRPIPKVRHEGLYPKSNTKAYPNSPTRRPTPSPTRRPTPSPTRRPTPSPTRRPTSELELLNDDQA